MEDRRRRNVMIGSASAIVAALIVVGLSLGFGSQSVPKATPTSRAAESSAATSSPSSSCQTQPFGCDESTTTVMCPPIATYSTATKTSNGTTGTYSTAVTTYSCTA